MYVQVGMLVECRTHINKYSVDIIVSLGVPGAEVWSTFVICNGRKYQYLTQTMIFFLLNGVRITVSTYLMYLSYICYETEIGNEHG